MEICCSPFTVKMYGRKEDASVRLCTGWAELDSQLLSSLRDCNPVAAPVWASFSSLYNADRGHVWAIKRGSAHEALGTERESPQDVTEKPRAQGSSSPEEGTVCPAALTSEPTPRGGGQRASALAESGDLSPGEAAGPVLTAQTPPAEPVQPAQ